MSEQDEVQHREDEADLLDWLSDYEGAKNDYAHATVRRIIAERDAARAEADAYRPIVESLCGVSAQTEGYIVALQMRENVC